MKKIVVLYHANCPDGFGAAWVAWKKFGKKADYFGIRPGQTADQLKGLNLKGREEIYFLDVSASVKDLRELVKENESVTVIDHHVSNRAIIHNATQWLFDNRHSGAVLASQFFFPEKPLPWLLRYLEEMDLWKFRLPRTREVSAWLELYPMEFKVWNKIAKDLERPVGRRKAIAAGELILKHDDRRIEKILKCSQEVRFKGFRARVVNAAQSHSQIGHLLIDRRHPVGIVWHEVSDSLKFSLRSNGKVDVSKIAKQFPGGGGHKAAAGFSLPLGSKLPWKRIRD